MVWSERAIWLAVVLIAGMATSRYETKRARRLAAATSAATGLSAELRAYVDQRCAARAPAAAAAPAAPADATARLAKMSEQIAALEATAAARNAALAECPAVHAEFRGLLNKQDTALDLVRDQELSRMRNRVAATCANASPARTPGASLRGR